jgi:hypothetical protein
MTTEPRPRHQLWADIFDGLAASLKENAERGPARSWWSFVDGNQYSPKPKDTGRPLDVRTMLAFELALHTRMWASGCIRQVYSTPQPMPRVRMPTGGWRLIETWTAATLGESEQGQWLKETLRTLPDTVALVPWPEERKV